MSAVLDHAGDDVWLAIFERASARVAAWDLAPMPSVVAPGFPALVERRAPALDATRGGRRDLSLVGFLAGLSGALLVPAWLSFAIWKGVRP